MLGALASVLSTWLVTGILVVEAIDRIQHPVVVDGRRAPGWRLLFETLIRLLTSVHALCTSAAQQVLSSCARYGRPPACVDSACAWPMAADA